MRGRVRLTGDGQRVSSLLWHLMMEVVSRELMRLRDRFIKTLTCRGRH